MCVYLVWLDKNWKGKGAAENVWLTVDYEKREFSYCVSTCCDTAGLNVIEVVRKSDIIAYRDALADRCGFKLV